MSRSVTIFENNERLHVLIAGLIYAGAIGAVTVPFFGQIGGVAAVAFGIDMIFGAFDASPIDGLLKELLYHGTQFAGMDAEFVRGEGFSFFQTVKKPELKVKEGELNIEIIVKRKENPKKYAEALYKHIQEAIENLQT